MAFTREFLLTGRGQSANVVRCQLAIRLSWHNYDPGTMRESGRHILFFDVWLDGAYTALRECLSRLKLASQSHEWPRQVARL